MHVVIFNMNEVRILLINPLDARGVHQWWLKSLGDRRNHIPNEVSTIEGLTETFLVQSAVRRLVAARRKKRARAKHSRQMRLERWQARSRNMDRQRELLYSQNKTEEMVSHRDVVTHFIWWTKLFCIIGQHLCNIFSLSYFGFEMTFVFINTLCMGANCLGQTILIFFKSSDFF